MAAPDRRPSPPAEGLRERNKREKRERIRRAARELFARRGFEATTARAICQRARVGTGTLFLYARDKRELLLQVFEEEARRRFAEGLAAAGRRRSLVPQLMALFGAFLDFYAAQPELARVIVRELFFREHAPDGMGALTRSYADHVTRLVEAAQARGEIRGDVSPRRAAHACFAHYTAMVIGWLGSGLLGEEEARAGLRDALVLQLEGLQPPRAPRRRP